MNHRLLLSALAIVVLLALPIVPIVSGVASASIVAPDDDTVDQSIPRRRSSGDTEPAGTTSTTGAPVTTPSKRGGVAPGGSPTTPAPTRRKQPPSPSGVGVCGESMSTWHPPVVNGCATRHEHGDPPPPWIAAAGYTVRFDGPFNTSAAENVAKHAAMKGFLARLNNVDIYFRPHAASNVLDRSARFHSYEVWARDPSGGVSHWQGWYNTGDPVADRIPRTQGDPGRRPIMLVVDRASYDQGIRCEQWYAITAVWSWDFGWTICGSTTIYYVGENQEQDRSSWRLSPDGTLGGTRRLEAAWYTPPSHSERPHPTGPFYATQFGQLVSGPNDARCSGTTTAFGVTYRNVCLPQFIAPTMQQVAFPGNAVQRTFDTTGVVVPN